MELKKLTKAVEIKDKIDMLNNILNRGMIDYNSTSTYYMVDTFRKVFNNELNCLCNAKLNCLKEELKNL